MLLSENIHKDEQVNGRANTWLGQLPAPTTGGGDDTNWEQCFGMVWVYDQNNPNSPLDLQAPINRDPKNAGFYAIPGDPYYTRPASPHSEVFNASFADGATKAINANIEYGCINSS